MQPSASGRSTEATSADSAVESVLYALMTVGRLLRHKMAGDSVDPGVFWLLKGLSGNDAMRVTELAALANLDASTVSRHVAQLHRSGLIERSQDPADGRAQRVAISDQGQTLLDDSLARRRAVLEKGLDDWDLSDIETFERLLSRFVHNIENISELEHA